jgi:hypothetical protein
VNAPIVIAAIAALAGCKFPDLVPRTEDDGGVTDVGADGPFVATSVQEVRASTTPTNTPVELTGVIVTAIDLYGPRMGDIWVQQPGGGPSSGILVFGVPIEVVQTLAFRDVVDVAGVKTEFALQADTTGRTVTEIASPPGGAVTVTKQNMQSTVTIDYLDAAVIGALSQAEYDEEMEKWEGAYVQLTNVRATTASMTLPNGSQRFTVPGFTITDELIGLPAAVAVGACFSVIRGPVSYFFSFNLLPVSGGLQTGTGCP